MINPADLVLPTVAALHPYEPGKPIEELQRELGIGEPIKLASNENPIGPSPMAVAAVAAALHDLNRYPDGSNWAVRKKSRRGTASAPTAYFHGRADRSKC